MNAPVDGALYSKVKTKIYKHHPVHSAYRSANLVREYKREFAAKYGSGKSPYRSTGGSRSPKTGLTRWFSEDWRNQRGGIGYSKPGDVYRPTRRVTRETPLTFDELSNGRIQRARREKMETGRIRRF